LLLTFFLWWMLIEIFSLAALPIVRRVFSWLPDHGYAFSKCAGLLLVSYLLWIGASARLLPNTDVGILVAFLSLVAISRITLLVNSRDQGRGSFIQEMKTFWQQNRVSVLSTEILFLLAFGGWTALRAYTPDKILFMSGEKFMEIGFLNGVLNSTYFPPLDPWMAGRTISYYYFGYVMMSILTRLSGAAPTIGFDLYDALLFGLTAVSAYGVVANLVAASRGKRWAAAAFGWLGALFVVGMGNLEGLLEGLHNSGILPAAFWNWIDIPDLANQMSTGSFYPGSGWWWWRASRVLHDLDLFHRPVFAQPIDEFPFFSFLLGDNHPHKMALPFVLFAIGLAMNLFFREFANTPGHPEAPAAERRLKWPVRIGPQDQALLLYLFYAVALGSLAFLNTWDFPIYLALVLLAFAAGRFHQRSPHSGPGPIAWASGLRITRDTLLLAVGLGVSSLALYAPFFATFSSQAGGVLPYLFPPTRLPQYWVMFGPFLAILAGFLYTTLLSLSNPRQRLRTAARVWLAFVGVGCALFLLIVLIGSLVFSVGNPQIQAAVQAMLGGLSLSQGIQQILIQRVSNPWLFLLLTALLALAAYGIWGGAKPTHNRPSAEGEDLPSAAACVSDGPSPAVRFALLLAFAGLGLSLLTEFLYLRDNFGLRMNTVFKFYFQSWVLLACASAFGLWWTVRTLAHAAQHSSMRVIYQIVAAVSIAAALVYPIMSITSRTEGFRYPPDLDAAATFAGKYSQSSTAYWAAQPDDWAGIEWLLHNGRAPDGGIPTLLEAAGGSYEIAGRMSAFTGFPTLLGWANHEGQWRGSDPEIEQRRALVQTIYTTSSTQEALDLLHRWQVKYVVLGNTERQYIDTVCSAAQPPCDPNQAQAKFNQSFAKVFSHGTLQIYQVP
jgi:YYY domain-containing protein